MFKTLLLGAAGLMVAALLVFLMMESSAVDSSYYVDHGTRVNLLRQSETDFATLAEALQNAYREGRAVPNSALVTLQRLQASRDELAALFASEQRPELTGAFETYSDSLDDTVTNAGQLIAQQRTLADSVNTVRTESPAVVRELRGRGAQALSQTVFGLAVDVMDYAAGTGGHSQEVLTTRIDRVAADRFVTSRLPGRLDKLIDGARSILATRGASSDTLAAIEASALPGSTRTLVTTLREINRSVVGRADRARTLLAFFSMLFFAGIGYTALKLRRSYSDLHDSKEALEQLNHSLEDRVEARTEQLSTAYEELKESQSQLVHAEKMSSLGELVAGISHEINTPLWYLLSNATMLQERLQSFATFVGVAEELLEQLRNGDKDKQRFVERLQELDSMLKNDGLPDDLEESTDLIRDSIEGLEQLSEMAQSLKDFSRLDRASVDRFNVNEGIEKSLLISRNFLKNRVTVNRRLGDIPPIMCAPSQINQIFLNLIKNASDAIGNDGTIDIETAHEDDKVIVRITDSGSGIEPEMLAKIRDPFFTTKEVGKGTGLGLSICDKIINAHFGELRIDSELGKGSTFTVILPVNQAAQGEDASALEAELDALDGASLAVSA